MFSLKPQPKPSISAHVVVETKKGTINVTASEKGVAFCEEFTEGRYPFDRLSYFNLTNEEADELVKAIQACRAARS